MSFLVDDIEDLDPIIVGSKKDFNFVLERRRFPQVEKYSLIFKAADVDKFREEMQNIITYTGRTLYDSIISQNKTLTPISLYTGVLLDRYLDKPDEWYSLICSREFNPVKDSVFNPSGEKIYIKDLDWSSFINNINKYTRYELLGR